MHKQQRYQLWYDSFKTILTEQNTDINPIEFYQNSTLIFFTNVNYAASVFQEQHYIFGHEFSSSQGYWDCVFCGSFVLLPLSSGDFPVQKLLTNFVNTSGT